MSVRNNSVSAREQRRPSSAAPTLVPNAARNVRLR